MGHDWQDRLPGGTEHVLIVEDEDALRESLCAVLERLGYEVSSASNGVEAEAIAGRTEIDLMMMDVILPAICGLTLAESIAAKQANVRILYMSGYTTEEVLDDHGRAPGLGFLQKPFGVETLATKLRDLLEVPLADPRLTQAAEPH